MFFISVAIVIIVIINNRPSKFLKSIDLLKEVFASNTAEDMI